MYRVCRYASVVQRTISDPERVTVHEQVDRLEVWLVKGRLNIVAAPGPCRVEVNNPGGRKLRLTTEKGRLRLSHHNGPRWLARLSWWRRSRLRCEVTIGVPPQISSTSRVASSRPGSVSAGSTERSSR